MKAHGKMPALFWEREHFLEPCLWPLIFTSSHYSVKWHERTCKVKSRRLVGIWWSKAKVRSSMVTFDLLGERRREPNFPHISRADLTGKKKWIPACKMYVLQPRWGQNFQNTENFNGVNCWFTRSNTFQKSFQLARYVSISWEIVFSEGEGSVSEDGSIAYKKSGSCYVLQQFTWTLTHATTNKVF